MSENITTPLLSGSYNDIYFNAFPASTLLDIGVPINEINNLLFKYYKQYLTSKIQSFIDVTLANYGYDSQSQLAVYSSLSISPYYDEAQTLTRWIYEAWNRWENIAHNSILTEEDAENWLKTNVPVL